MKTQNVNLYSLLKSKSIIAILDGDTKCQEYTFKNGKTVEVAMPYLSGPALCELSVRFGLPATYSGSKNAVNLSRWQYLDNLMRHCIAGDRMSDLLGYLFRKEGFSGVLLGCSEDEANVAYTRMVDNIIRKINEILAPGGNELVIINEQFIVHTVGDKVEVQAPKIKVIDRKYIKSISDRAMEDIERRNYDSAITKSRTLLEEVFCYVIEKKDVNPNDSGDINKLFKQVKDLYNMHTDDKTDKRINMLLSGLNSIVSAIAEMRNKDSDAHGVGAKRITIYEYHARLFVNASNTLADFILSVESRANSK